MSQYAAACAIQRAFRERRLQRLADDKLRDAQVQPAHPSMQSSAVRSCESLTGGSCRRLRLDKHAVRSHGDDLPVCTCLISPVHCWLSQNRQPSLESNTECQSASDSRHSLKMLTLRPCQFSQQQNGGTCHCPHTVLGATLNSSWLSCTPCCCCSQTPFLRTPALHAQALERERQATSHLEGQRLALERQNCSQMAWTGRMLTHNAVTIMLEAKGADPHCFPCVQRQPNVRPAA